MARIREVEFDDLEMLFLIEETCFDDPWDDLTLQAELFLYDNSYYYVLEEDNKVIGYGGFILEDNYRHLSTIAILPEYQNRGLGKDFIKFLTEGKSYLEVSVTNLKAIKIYESLGFKKKEFLKDYYPSGDAYLMEKEEI